MFDLFAGTTTVFFINFVILDDTAAAFSFFAALTVTTDGVDIAHFRDLSFMLEFVASAAADSAAVEFLLLLLWIFAFTGVTTSFF